MTITNNLSVAEKMDFLGLYDTESFLKYYEDKLKNGIYDTDELNLLSPDNVDNEEFWKECDKRFVGSICGTASIHKKEFNIDEINWYNYLFATQLGVLNYIDYMCITGYNQKPPIKLNILEIGPGHGCLVSRLSDGDKDYRAIDVNPRFPGVIKCKGDGSFSESIAGENIPKFTNIVSCNVFQHLSIFQRREYYKSAYNALIPSGMLSFTCLCIPLSRNVIRWNNDLTYGAQFICHMGQYTEIQEYKTVLDELMGVGFQIVSTTRRHDGNYCFHVLRLPDEKESNSTVDGTTKGASRES